MANGYGHRYDPRGVKPFRFPKPRRAEPATVSRLREPPDPDEKFYIRGRKVTNIEYWLYQALLDRYGDGNIINQPSYIRGRNIPGEIRPDFAVTGQGMLLIFFADGERWHGSAQQRAEAKRNDGELMKRLNNSAMPPIHIWGSELQSKEDALAALARRGLG